MSAASKLHFCEDCAFSAGRLLARIAELETRRVSGIQLKAVRPEEEEAPATQPEPGVTRRLASRCR